jgi:hypothetical protein
VSYDLRIFYAAHMATGFVPWEAAWNGLATYLKSIRKWPFTLPLAWGYLIGGLKFRGAVAFGHILLTTCGTLIIAYC